MVLAVLSTLFLLAAPAASPDGTAQEQAAACEKSSAISCGPAGYAYLTGAGVTKDVARALRLYRRGCQRGDGRSCALLGIVHAEGNAVAKDVKEARKLYERGCRLRSGAACNNLGNFHFDGTGVKADRTVARRLFGQGCTYGDGGACTTYGSLLEEGIGGPSDKTGGVAAYKSGCLDASHADPLACKRYGLRILDADPEQAEVVFSKACRVFEDDHLCALTGLASMRRPGGESIGVTMVVQQCERGNHYGCGLAGEYYDRSDDPSDIVRARDFFEKGCRLGNTFSCETIDRTGQ